MINKPLTISDIQLEQSQGTFRNALTFFSSKQFGNLIDKACLSQWWMCSFCDNEQVYTCCEQYMMYQKAKLFRDSASMTAIMQAKTPREMKALGRLVKGFDNRVWQMHSQNLVIQGNMLKFSQNPELAAFLVDTGSSLLIEASPYDKIWGVGISDPAARDIRQWRGENRLGFILMFVRDALIDN